MTNYAIKSERVHTINQLLKAYTMFEKDDEYVVIDGQVKIVDEQTDVSWKAAATPTACIRLSKPKNA